MPECWETGTLVLREENPMATSKIEWTESTWNPVTGCTKISSGCKNCYAERMAKRLQAMGTPNYANGFEVAIHPHVLDYPLHWRKSNMIFVNSMSDLFHKDVPLDFIKDIFQIMEKANWHTFQVLTKRAERLFKVAHKLNWAPNIWMGVTVESSDYTERIKLLSETPAKVKFISFEPLLSSINKLNLKGIDWAIIGGESGPGARPMEEDWVLDIKRQCRKHKVPFFFKQWGGTNKKKAGRSLRGRTYDEMPVTYNV